MRSKHIVPFGSARAGARVLTRRDRPRAATGLRAQLDRAASSSRGTRTAARRFYPDDPIWRDGDMRDIPPVAEFDLSKSYEFLNETFGETVQSHGPALNVNTLGEVPDSSWFTNRLGLPRHDHRRSRPRPEPG